MHQAPRIQNPQDIIAILWRRRWQVIIPAFILFVISAIVTFTWPRTYQSKATILIEEPDFAGDYLQTAGFADQRVQVISQQVLSRQNLIKLIEKFDLYPEALDIHQLSMAATGLRESIKIAFISAEVNDPQMAGRRQATIAFTLSFDHQEPDTAHKVADELVSLFLAENSRNRREKAAETAGFLTKEAEKLAQKISEQEAKLAAFKLQNTGSLPEQVPHNREALFRYELQLLSLRQQIQSQEERRVYLESQLTQVSPHASITLDDGTVLRPEERLKKLQAEYSELSYTYGPKHPRMIEISTEMEGLKETLGGSGQGGGDRPSNPAFIQLQAELTAVNANLRSMRSERADLSQRFEDLDIQTRKAPDIEREYLLLMRNYENATTEYRAVREKLADAERREALESDVKGQRFSVIEPPLPPLQPIAPKRRILMLIGLMISAVGGLGVAAIAEVLDQTVSSPRHLAAITGSAPLVVIPYIETSVDRQKAWGMSVLVVVSLTAVFVGGLFAVNEFLVPLDDLWARWGPGAGAS